MSANILAVLLVFGCGLIHLVTGQCIVVKKSEEKVEEAKSDVWLPNRFHGKINVFLVLFFVFVLWFFFSRKQIIRYKRFRFEWGKNLNSRISRLHNVCMVLSFYQYVHSFSVDWISGCEYNGVQMKPGNEVIFPFPDCTVCVCTDKSRVICCR